MDISTRHAAQRQRWTRDHRIGAVSAGIGVVGLLLTVLGWYVTRDPDERSIDGPGCVIDAGNPTDDCLDTDPPTASVYRLPDQNRWGVKIRDFQPNSEVTLRLFDPKGREQDLGAFGTRNVDARGNADTKPNYYLWEYEQGEPQGKYRLEVIGIDRSGEKAKVIPTEFIVSERAISPSA